MPQMVLLLRPLKMYQSEAFNYFPFFLLFTFHIKQKVSDVQ